MRYVEDCVGKVEVFIPVKIDLDGGTANTSKAFARVSLERVGAGTDQ
jgi:hypothetical protein